MGGRCYRGGAVREANTRKMRFEGMNLMENGQPLVRSAIEHPTGFDWVTLMRISNATEPCC